MTRPRTPGAHVRRAMTAYYFVGLLTGALLGALFTAGYSAYALVAAGAIALSAAFLGVRLENQTADNVDTAVALAHAEGVKRGGDQTCRKLAGRLHHEPTEPLNGDDW